MVNGTKQLGVSNQVAQIEVSERVSSAGTCRGTCPGSCKTIMKRLQESCCSQERSTGNKGIQETKKEQGEGHFGIGPEQKSKLKEADEEAELQQILQAKETDLEGAVKEERVHWRLKICGQTNETRCTTMRRVAIHANATLGCRRQRDLLKLDMECSDKLEKALRT